VILLALFFSLSRGGIVCSLIALTLLAGVRRKEVLFLVGGCWLGMLAYGTVIGWDQLQERFDRFADDAPGYFILWEDAGRQETAAPAVSCAGPAACSSIPARETGLPQTSAANAESNIFFVVYLNLELSKLRLIHPAPGHWCTRKRWVHIHDPDSAPNPLSQSQGDSGQI